MQRIRGSTRMRYTNLLLLTYLLTPRAATMAWHRHISPMNFIIQQSEFRRRLSAFRFVSRAVCSPYSTLNLRRPSFSGRRRWDLEQSSAARHMRAVTSRLLHSLGDILLRTVLFIILLSCLRSDIVILDTLIVFTYLLIYLLTGYVLTVASASLAEVRALLSAVSILPM